MFLDFFQILRNNKINVTLKEYIDLLGALKAELHNYNLEDFYYLSKTCLIKRETDLDKFDQLFSSYFRGIDLISTEEFLKIPEDWLRRNSTKILSPEEMEKIKALGGLDKLMERIQELLKEQKERHEGGNKWIGTGGTSPFGAYGFNPEGIRIGQHESRHQRAVKVWDKREFSDLRDDLELNTRNLKMALRKLRLLTRTGSDEELDLKGTIKKTSDNAGYLDLQMLPKRKNTVKILMLLDIGGSMDGYIERCSQLFSAAKYEFKHLEYFYFHNCVYEKLWKDNFRRHDDFTTTWDVINKYPSDYKVIFVGDAAMSPYEILSQYGSVEHYNEEAGIVWLERIKNHFKDIVWLNPTKEKHWNYTQSTNILKEFFENKMFPLTVKGIEQAVLELKQ